jgi:predicted MFS family arabinose efflux permease
MAEDTDAGNSPNLQVLAPSALALTAILSVLVAGGLSFGIFPLIVDGLVRLGHLSVEAGGLSVSAEMVGQSLGAAIALVAVRRAGSRRVALWALVLIVLGNALTAALYHSYTWLITLRVIAGIGCGLTVVCIGLLAATRQADRNFAIYNTANLLGDAAVAASLPPVLGAFGIPGMFAVIAIAATACLFVVTQISNSSGEIAPSFGAHSSGTGSAEVAMTCAMTVAYFASLIMFWSYAGDIGARHGVSEAIVSSAVAQAWLVGGLGGSIVAMLLVKRVPRMTILVVSAIGNALTTYLGVAGAGATEFSVVLIGFVFFWMLLYPVQMGLFAQVDPSGRLAMIAWFVQLIACAIGPALGGLVLRVGNYSILPSVCGVGYFIFVATALLLARSARRRSAHTATSC